MRKQLSRTKKQKDPFIIKQSESLLFHENQITTHEEKLNFNTKYFDTK